LALLESYAKSLFDTLEVKWSDSIKKSLQGEVSKELHDCGSDDSFKELTPMTRFSASAAGFRWRTFRCFRHTSLKAFLGLWIFLLFGNRYSFPLVQKVILFGWCVYLSWGTGRIRSVVFWGMI